MPNKYIFISSQAQHDPLCCSGDNILDLAVLNGDTTVTILLGEGSGIDFTTAPIINSIACAFKMAAADFNQGIVPIETQLLYSLKHDTQHA